MLSIVNLNDILYMSKAEKSRRIQELSMELSALKEHLNDLDEIRYGKDLPYEQVKIINMFIRKKNMFNSSIFSFKQICDFLNEDEEGLKDDMETLTRNEWLAIVPRGDMDFFTINVEKVRNHV